MIAVSETAETSDSSLHTRLPFAQAPSDVLLVDRFRVTLQEAGARLDALAKGTAFSPARGAVRPPPAPAILLGRAAVLEAARDLRPEVPARRLALIGPGGSGKSALLRALANDGPFVSNFHDVVYVRAANQPLADVLSQIFAALHVEGSPRYVPTSNAWLDRAPERSVAVLVDDADVPFDIASLAAALPNATLVIASNDPIPGFSWQPLTPLAPEDALWLLCSLTAAGPFAQDAARMLCDTFYGNPARLRQIAILSAVSGKSLIELAGNIRSSMMLDDMLVTSVAQLDVRKRALFDAIFVFGAAAALGDDPEALELATSGSIVAEGDGWRLSPGLEGRFAKRAIDAPAFAGAMQSCGTRLSEHLRAIDDPSRLQRTFAAARRAAELERWGDAIAIGRALSDAFARCGAWEQWKACLEFVDSVAVHEGSETTQAWVLHQTGTRAACLGEHGDAKTLLRDALNRRKNAGDAAGAEVTKHNLDVLGASSRKATLEAPVEPPLAAATPPPAPAAAAKPVTDAAPKEAAPQAEAAAASSDTAPAKKSNRLPVIAGGAVAAAALAAFFLVPLGRPHAPAPAVVAQASAPVSKARSALHGQPHHAARAEHHTPRLAQHHAAAKPAEHHTVVAAAPKPAPHPKATAKPVAVAAAPHPSPAAPHPSAAPPRPPVAVAPRPAAAPRAPVAAAPAFQQPQITGFGVSRQLVAWGSATNLCMNVKHATHVRLSAVSNGRQTQLPVPASATRGDSGCIRVSPKDNTRYTLVATSPAGQAYRVLAVDVFKAPPPAAPATNP
jgi:hypothetical protein